MAMAKQRIVVIEDEQDVRQLLRRRLQAHRFEVWEAANGLEGVAVVKTIDPDLVIIDLNLPGLDGIEVYRQIRFEMERKIPILFITALSASQTIQESSLQLIALTKHDVTLEGPYRVLGKPYDHKELIALVEEMLRENRQTD